MTRLTVKSIAALTCIGAIMIGLSGCHSQDAAPPPPTVAPVAQPVSAIAKGQSAMRAAAAAHMQHSTQ